MTSEDIIRKSKSLNALRKTIPHFRSLEYYYALAMYLGADSGGDNHKVGLAEFCAAWWIWKERRVIFTWEN